MLSTKRIKLTQGQYAKVDAEDYAILKRYSWCAFWTETNHSYYALNGKLGLMHRFIVNAPRGLLVDHKNHDTLDNRKENLRICSHRRNQHNMQMHADNKTGFKEVSRGCGSMCARFRARIHVDGKEKLLGWFDTPAQAASAYDTASRKYFGDFACSNERRRHENTA